MQQNKYNENWLNGFMEMPLENWWIFFPENKLWQFVQSVS